MAKQIAMTDGVPDLFGAYIFLMWDGMLTEGILHRGEDGQRMMTMYVMDDPAKPRPITFRADSGKIVAYATVTGAGRV